MTTTVHPIQKTKGICGGYARIRDTRIPVWSLVSLRLQGANKEYLLSSSFNRAITKDSAESFGGEIGIDSVEFVM